MKWSNGNRGLSSGSKAISGVTWSMKAQWLIAILYPHVEDLGNSKEGALKSLEIPGGEGADNIIPGSSS